MSVLYPWPIPLLWQPGLGFEGKLSRTQKDLSSVWETATCMQSVHSGARGLRYDCHHCRWKDELTSGRGMWLYNTQLVFSVRVLEQNLSTEPTKFLRLSIPDIMFISIGQPKNKVWCWARKHRSCPAGVVLWGGADMQVSTCCRKTSWQTEVR